MTTVLLSGGLDSAVCLHWALERRDIVQAVTVDYGQRHRREINAAYEIAKATGVSHEIVFASATGFGVASQLTPGEGFDPSQAPVLPGRNMILLSIAAAFAAKDDGEIIIGSCADDERDFPDCRDRFFLAAQEALSAALDTPITINTPLLHMGKPEIVTMAVRLGPDAVRAAKWSWSCYDPQPDACGVCGACRLRHVSGADRLADPPVRQAHD